MPDAFEFPRVRFAVVEEVFADLALVDKFVALARRKLTGGRQLLAAGNGPGFAAVIGALHDLSEPAARLRRVYPVRISRRALYVVDLPTAKKWPADLPIFALAV